MLEILRDAMKWALDNAVWIIISKALVFQFNSLISYYPDFRQFGWKNRIPLI